MDRWAWRFRPRAGGRTPLRWWSWMRPTSPDADNLDALLAAVKPTIDAGGRLILLSTADKSKPQSAFKRIYGAGKRGENGYQGDLPAVDGPTGAVGGVVRGAET